VHTLFQQRQHKIGITHMSTFAFPYLNVKSLGEFAMPRFASLMIRVGSDA
jgi:hypothetical protein